MASSFNFDFGDLFTTVATAVVRDVVSSAVNRPRKRRPTPQPPARQEIQAQKQQEDLVDQKKRKEAQEREARGKTITARAAGPQTLFTRPGQIPKARKLGGGRTVGGSTRGRRAA